VFRLLISLLLLTFGTSANSEVTFKVIEPNCPEFICGTAHLIYIEGEIGNNDAERFEALVNSRDIPVWSTVYLNSPGGSLFGGMELARVIRSSRFNTSVGKLDSFGEHTRSGAVCFSACSLAYLGGEFRYTASGSEYGVHRFYSSNPNADSAELAQVASAAIIAFLHEMGIPSSFFLEMTKASSMSMRILSTQKMLDLGIANNGIGPTSWEVKATDPSSGVSALYVKGERNTSYGINKVLFLCSPDGGGIIGYVIFDPQGRSEEVRSMRAISLELDGESYPISNYLIDQPETMNGWINAAFMIPERYWQAINRAREIGFLFQHSYQAPIFLGISGLPMEGSKGLLAGFEKSCPAQPDQSSPSMFERFQNLDLLGDDLTQHGYKGVSISKCEDICRSTPQCTAYSYVRSSSWCFPKNGIGNPTPKSGIVSGRLHK